MLIRIILLMEHLSNLSVTFIYNFKEIYGEFVTFLQTFFG